MFRRASKVLLYYLILQFMASYVENFVLHSPTYNTSALSLNTKDWLHTSPAEHCLRVRAKHCVRMAKWSGGGFAGAHVYLSLGTHQQNKKENGIQVVPPLPYPHIYTFHSSLTGTS